MSHASISIWTGGRTGRFFRRTRSHWSCTCARRDTWGSPRYGCSEGHCTRRLYKVREETPRDVGYERGWQRRTTAATHIWLKPDFSETVNDRLSKLLASIFLYSERHPTCMQQDMSAHTIHMSRRSHPSLSLVRTAKRDVQIGERVWDLEVDGQVGEVHFAQRPAQLNTSPKDPHQELKLVRSLTRR